MKIRKERLPTNCTEPICDEIGILRHALHGRFGNFDDFVAEIADNTGVCANIAPNLLELAALVSSE
jgi:hypothetical protein